MPSPLSYIYSSIDSLKRQLFDAVANPVAHAEKSIGYGLDKSNKFREQLATANSNSVLVSKEEKAGAQAQLVDSMMGMLAGNAGIIVPVGAVPKSMISSIHAQPLTGKQVATIPQSLQKLNEDIIEQVGADPKTGEMLYRVMAGYSPADLFTKHSSLPPDLVEYLSNLKLVAKDGPRASGSFSPLDDTISLAPATRRELLSTGLHEVSHSGQYLYDMPMGGSPKEFISPNNYRRLATAQQVVEDRLKQTGVTRQQYASMAPKEAVGSREAVLSSPESLKYLFSSLQGYKKAAHQNYLRLAGETEARLVQKMFEENLYPDNPKLLMESMGYPESSLIPRSAIRDNMVDSDGVLSDLLNLVLGAPAGSATKAGSKP